MLITLYNTTDRRVLSFVETLKFEYDFHPESNRFRLMHWDALCELASDIEVNGLEEKIKLFEGKVLDGRNRYIACLMAKVVPEFERLPEDTNAKDYVWTKNFHRRHFTKAERARYGLEILGEEREKAAERKKSTQFKKKNGKKPSKSSVRTNLVRTVEPEKKGRAIKIVAGIVDLDPFTLRAYEKITIVAKYNEEIKKDLEKINQGTKTIHSVYSKINGSSKKKNKTLKEEPPKEKLNRVTECDHFRAAPCPSCMAQLMACKLDLKGGNFMLKNECPDPCDNSSIEV